MELQARPGGHAADRRSACATTREFILALDRRRGVEAGRALHGLRHPVLPERLPDQQHHSGLERPRLPRSSGATALDVLHSTNNFPEFTGRICPAPCEAACTLNINDDPVGIKSIEHFIIDKGWEEGWVCRTPPAQKDRQARCGDRLRARRGSRARSSSRARATMSSLFEKADRIGGLLRYGIPDFKMEKHLIDRRMAQMSIEGVEFRPGVHVGKGRRARERIAAELRRGRASLAAPRRRAIFRCRAAISRASTSRWSSCRSRTGSSPATRSRSRSWRPDKHVVVIGGGDTGSGLRRHVESPGREVGHAVRAPAAAAGTREQAARRGRIWPIKLRTSSSQEEGCDRDWAVADQAASRAATASVEKLVAVRVEWRRAPTGS